MEKNNISKILFFSIFGNIFVEVFLLLIELLSIFNKMITTGIGTSFTRYNPYFCIGVVLVILFVLWVFYGGKTYDFIGLAPLDPNTHVEYTGSLYSWGNQSSPHPNQSPSHQSPSEQSPSEQFPSEQFPSNEPIHTNQSAPQKFPHHSYDITQPPSLQDISVSQVSVSNTISNTISMNSVDEPLYQNVCPHSSPKICLPEDRMVIQDMLVIDDTPALPSQFLPPQFLPSQGLNVIPKGPSKMDKRLPSRGERICCQTMERIYGMPFKSTWPSWLRNPETGAGMELDCFNDDLKIAVEYNGSQHYQWPNFTNQSYEEFMNQVRRDDLKKRICDRNGVYLITVPHNVPHEKIPEYITLYLPETIKNRINEEHTLQDIK